MQKSHLSSFHNDPRLTRYPNDKKIQPLFKKSFGQAEETLKKHIEDEGIQSTSGPINRSVPPKIKIRNISAAKNSGLSRENLEFLINKLKSEKLEVFRDLFTYTEKYDHKLCTRARLFEMKGLCHDLLEMSRVASERLNEENDLFGYLQMGTLTLSQEKFLCEESEEEQQETEEFYQKLVGISGVPCICLVKVLEDENVNLSIYPYLSNQAIAVDLDINREEQDLEEILTRSVFPFLTFSSFTNGIGLKHLESPFGNYKFYLNLRFSSQPVEVLVVLEGLDIQINCFEETLSIQDQHLFDLLYHENLLQAGFYLSDNLFYFPGNSTPLVWKAKNWEIEKFEKKDAKVQMKFREIQEFPGKFDVFYKFCFEITVKNLEVKVWKNLVSGKGKISLRSGDELIEIKEEVYHEEFLLLLSFQDLDLRWAKTTLPKSLEFQMFLEKFIDFE
jgi:hypothetical protein